jgi:hypothetical protein
MKEMGERMFKSSDNKSDEPAKAKEEKGIV